MTPSRSSIIENKFFGEGYYDFSLPIKQIERLQELTGVGPMPLYNRIRGNEWKVSDLIETIRLGLIGGGMAPQEAFQLVSTYVIDQPYVPNVITALEILAVLLYGVPTEESVADHEDDDDIEDEGEDPDVKKKG
jgi:hypothetical protein